MAMKAEEPIRPLTYHDLETYPEDSRLRYEIINGELVVTPAAMPDHGQIVLALYDAFKDVVKGGNLGRLWVAPVDVELSSHNIVQPDVLFIAQDRLEIVRRVIHGAPDLAIEVVSSCSRSYDYVAKRALYEVAGVKEYWIVDPQLRSIEVLVLEDGAFVSASDDDGIARSVIVPGVQVGISRLFDEFTA